MDAPRYLPARAYEPPRFVPEAPSSTNVAVADLVKIQQARAILLEEIPGFEMIAAHPLLRPHLTNFTVATMAEFGMVQPDAVARVDARLRTLPPVEYANQ